VAGLVAVLSSSGRHIPSDELARLTEAYQYVRGIGPLRVKHAGHFAHAAVVDGAVPGRDDDQGDNWGLSVGALRSDRRLASTRPEALDGQFASVLHRAAEGTVYVVADPYGMQALYMAEREGLTFISTSSTALARHLGAEVDPLGVEVFLRAGYHCGPITYWKGIFRVEPGTWLRTTRDGTRQETWWLTRIDEDIRKLSFDATVERLVDVLLAGMETYDLSHAWLDLTGGFDSRLTTVLALAAGFRPTTNTVGTDADPDVVMGREVAKVADLEWRQFDLSYGWAPTADDLRTAAAWADGTLEVLQLATVLETHARKARAYPLLVTGGGLEHASAKPWLHAPWAGRTRGSLVGPTVRYRYLKGSPSRLLANDPTARVAEYLKDSFASRASLHVDGRTSHRLDEIYAYKSVGHFGAYRSASEAHISQVMPAYWRDVFTTTFSANPRWRSGHRLHRAIIERLRPDLAQIATTRGGPATSLRLGNGSDFLPYYRGLALSAATRIRRLETTSRTSPQQADAIAMTIRALREQGILQPGAMLSGQFLDSGALSVALATVGQPGGATWTELGRVGTVELTLRATT